MKTGPWTTCWAACTGRGDGKAFEGVIGKELSNPIPGWAEHGAGRKVVPYGVSADMDSPDPDSGEEWYHTNTQLFGAIDVLDADGRQAGNCLSHSLGHFLDARVRRLPNSVVAPPEDRYGRSDICHCVIAPRNDYGFTARHGANFFVQALEQPILLLSPLTW